MASSSRGVTGAPKIDADRDCSGLSAFLESYWGGCAACSPELSLIFPLAREAKIPKMHKTAHTVKTASTLFKKAGYSLGVIGVRPMVSENASVAMPILNI